MEEVWLVESDAARADRYSIFDAQGQLRECCPLVCVRHWENAPLGREVSSRLMCSCDSLFCCVPPGKRLTF
jgi:hypothetical protein